MNRAQPETPHQLRVGIAGIFDRRQESGGVYSVFTNLLQGIAAQVGSEAPNSRYEVTALRSVSDSGRTPAPLLDRRVSGRWGRFIAETQLAITAGAQFDSLLFLNYHVPFLSRCAHQVVVIHDLQFLHFPENFSRSKRLWLGRAIRAALNRADRIITISQAVRDDILKMFGSAWRQKITPIWNPIDFHRFTSPADYSPTGDRPFILSVAVDRTAKNLISLVRAFAVLRRSHPDHCLVLAGKLGATPSGRHHTSAQPAARSAVSAAIHELGLQDHVKVTGFISNEQLGELYRRTDLFVMPSLFEGFGMPAIEALCLGAPILVSDIPPLREITFNQATYIPDPTDSIAIAAQISDHLKGNHSCRPSPDLIARCMREFAPTEIARQYLHQLTP